MFTLNGEPSPENVYIFNGDYVRTTTTTTPSLPLTYAPIHPHTHIGELESENGAVVRAVVLHDADDMAVISASSHQVDRGPQGLEVNLGLGLGSGLGPQGLEVNQASLGGKREENRVQN